MAPDTICSIRFDILGCRLPTFHASPVPRQDSQRSRAPREPKETPKRGENAPIWPCTERSAFRSKRCPGGPKKALRGLTSHSEALKLSTGGPNHEIATNARGASEQPPGRSGRMDRRPL
eukprot:5938893-Pyramimonas_sp.AAC.1